MPNFTSFPLVRRRAGRGLSVLELGERVPEGEEALEDLVAVLALRAEVLDLAHDRGERLLAVADERLTERLLPDEVDHLGALVLGAGRADPRAIAHLGQRRLEVADVRRLIGADVAHEIGGLAVAGDERLVAQP